MDNNKGKNSKKTPARKAAAAPSATPKSTATSQSTATSSVATNQPASQSPIMNSVVPPKKKTGRIIGIVIGLIVLLLAIAAVLLYFFWWQNPQKIVTDAIVNSFQVKKAVSSGKLVMNLGDGNKVDIKLKAAADAPKSKTEATIKLAINGMETKRDIVLTMVVDGAKNTTYIKVDHLKDIMRQMAETIIKAKEQAAPPNAQSTALRDQVLKNIDEKFDKLEGKWLKLSPDDFAELRSSNDTCSREVYDLIHNDQQARNELIDAYRKNSFITVKKDAKIEPRDGAPGFEIDLTSDGKMFDKLRAFVDSLRETKLGKKIKECYGDQAFNAVTKATPPEGLPTLRVWVDSWSHQLKAIEIKAHGSDDDKSRNIAIDMTFDYSKSEQIDIPSNANSFKSVLQDFLGSSSLSPFAGGDTSTGASDGDTNISVER